MPAAGGFKLRRTLRRAGEFYAARDYCFEIVLAAYSDYLCSTWNRGDLLVKENVCHLEPEFMNSLVLIDMFDLCFLKNRLAMNLQNYFLIN